MLRDYANDVAKLVNGEVKEVEKTNGVINTGVVVNQGSNISPVVYLDQMFEEGLTVREAADVVIDIANRHARTAPDLDFIKDFEAVKPMLRARLYNEKTSADIKKSAAGYGFPDLVIVPYIDNVIENGSIKVNFNMLENWGVSAAEVIEIAEENSRQEATMKSMVEVLQGLGYPIPDLDDQPEMIVVSSTSGSFGAYSIIARLDDLKQRFKNGFTVLPSSVHEVIVVEEDAPETFDNMVNEVNNTEVDYTDVLSNHSYRIAA